MASPNPGKADSLYRTGAQIVTSAVEADHAQEFPKALHLYQKAGEYFVAGLKADRQHIHFHARQRKWQGRKTRNNNSNNNIRRRAQRMAYVTSKVSAFFDRAEAIKAYLAALEASQAQAQAQTQNHNRNNASSNNNNNKTKKLTKVDAKSMDDVFKGVIGAEHAKQVSFVDMNGWMRWDG